MADTQEELQRRQRALRDTAKHHYSVLRDARYDIYALKQALRNQQQQITRLKATLDQSSGDNAAGRQELQRMLLKQESLMQQLDNQTKILNHARESLRLALGDYFALKELAMFLRGFMGNELWCELANEVYSNDTLLQNTELLSEVVSSEDLQARRAFWSTVCGKDPNTGKVVQVRPLDFGIDEVAMETAYNDRVTDFNALSNNAPDIYKPLTPDQVIEYLSLRSEVPVPGQIARKINETLTRLYPNGVSIDAINTLMNLKHKAADDFVRSYDPGNMNVVGNAAKQTRLEDLEDTYKASPYLFILYPDNDNEYKNTGKLPAFNIASSEWVFEEYEPPGEDYSQHRVRNYPSYYRQCFVGDSDSDTSSSDSDMD